MDGIEIAIQVKKTLNASADDEALFLDDLASILGPLNVKLTYSQHIIIAIYLTLVGK